MSLIETKVVVSALFIRREKLSKRKISSITVLNISPIHDFYTDEK